MTFEEIHQSIFDGVPALNLEEAEQSLDLLIRLGGNVETMIALKIAEAQTLSGKDPAFLERARAKWKFKGEKTIFHYISAGKVLLALRDFKGTSDLEKENRTIENQAAKSYKICVGLEETKLEALSVLFNKKGIVEVMNFLKLHFKQEFTVRELRQELAKIYGFGKTTSDDGQLMFDFFTPIEAEKIVDVMEQPSFNETIAMTMAYNGAMLCRNANRYLKDNLDKISDDELDNFEELAADLAEAKSQLDDLLAIRKRALLGIQ